MADLLVYQDVHFSYSDKKVLKHIDLRVKEGRFLVIVGESGSGKSTLLKLTMGLLDMNTDSVSGSIIFQGRNLLSLKKKEWLNIRGTQIGMIFQNAAQYFDDYQTIGRQYQRMLAKHGLANKDVYTQMCQSLKRVTLQHPEEVLAKYPFELSGGMAQRTAIAMALDLHPLLLLADEPTSALDVTSQKQLLDELAALKKNTSLTMVMVTHNMAVAAYLADDIAVMKNGEIIEVNSRDQILNDPVNKYTQDLLQAAKKWGVRQDD